MSGEWIDGKIEGREGGRREKEEVSNMEKRERFWERGYEERDDGTKRHEKNQHGIVERGARFDVLHLAAGRKAQKSTG